MIEQLDDSFSGLNDFIRKIKPSTIYIVADENTHEYCLPLFLGNLETDVPFEILEIEAGEDMKTVESAAQMWSILAEMKADRKSLIINVGGGVITDLGGFVASTYKRGIKFINIPTSLLGMCDAALGGKTGVDLDFLKNLVGTFALPERVFLYPNFLKTLDTSEVRSGFAEMLKHGLVWNTQHWNDLQSIENPKWQLIQPFILQSMKIKQEIVEMDFEEKNIRKILNFGHTVGHAVESALLSAGRPVPHGFAVAAGMICETKLAELTHLIDAETSKKIICVLKKFFPEKLAFLDHNDLIKLMQHDKKNSLGKTNFSLISGIGSCQFDVQVEESLLLCALEFYTQL